MIRTIIQIDEDKCTGCGLCVTACHEGALGLVDGKAKLLRDDYCDGMGDCLPACPFDAISFVEREAAAYDEAAVQANMAAKAQAEASGCEGGCAANLEKLLERLDACFDESAGQVGYEPASGSVVEQARAAAANAEAGDPCPVSALGNWPVQIKLVPPTAPYFAGCDLLIAADCTAFAYGRFHADFMDGRVVLIGCPKLDAVDYAEKLTAILAANDVRSIVVTRMQVPCCGGIEMAVKRAVAASGRDVPLEIVTITSQGDIL